MERKAVIPKSPDDITEKVGSDMFAQLTPCEDCPFRRNGGVRHGMVALNYASYFVSWPGFTFPCHRTVPKDDNREEFAPWREGQHICPGGLILAEKLGACNLPMAIGKEKGWYHPEKLVGRDEVFDSLREMAEANWPTKGEVEK